MKLFSKVRGLQRSLLIFVAFLLVFSTAAPLAQVFADSADPVLPIPQGQVVHNGDGTTTITMNGQWQWTTHDDNKGDGSKDCNADRWAVGWAIDWHDASQPGNLVQNGALVANVGTPTDNNVHFMHLAGDSNPLGDPIGATRCGVYGQHGAVYYNTGDWGPISHTYPAGVTDISACVVTYDIHEKNGGPDPNHLVAGGPNHNNDNSIQANGSTPAGNGCFSPPSTIDICHATSSNSNPYVVNHPDKSGDVSGHDGHNGPIWFPGINVSWGDIIPPFDYVDNNGATQHYPGKNWDATGQAVFNNGCSVNGTLTVNKVLNPSNDPGKFDLKIDNTTKASNVGDGGTTGVVSLTPGQHNVSEAAGSNTTLSDYSASISGDCDTNGDVNLGVAQNLTCTITNNRKPTLTLVKTVVNNNGGDKLAKDFQAKIDGGNVSWSTANQTTVGSHTASEVNLPGYSAGNWGGDCAANGNITLSAGQNATCTITNDDIAPSLTITKLVINNHGGSLGASDFPLFVDNTQVTSGATNTQFNAGSHNISEIQQTGYHFKTVSGDCSYSAQTGITLTMSLGGNYTCTITNEDVGPTLTVVKNVINNNGGNATADKFNVKVNGTQLTSGVLSNGNLTDTYTFPKAVANTAYTVSEDSFNGYTQTSLVCKDNDTDNTVTNPVTLSLAQNVTCVITNNDIAPTLKLVKHVINNNSGTNQPQDWTLTATGTNGFSDFGDSTTFHTVDAGVSYALSESNVSGYYSQGWSCNAGTQNGSSITLNLDQNVTCIVTNNDIPHPAIHVVKDGPATAHEGDTVTYTFDVTNVGDTPSLSGITVNDDVAGLGSFQGGDTNSNSLLDKGETWVYTKDYVVPTPQTPDVTNTVEACGNYYTHKVCDTDQHTLDVIHPAINVYKYGPATAFAGDTVTYEFDVTNVGDTPLSGLTVNDNISGVGTYQYGDTNSNDMLDLGETWVYTKQFAIPANQTSDITNTVTACGTDSLQLQACDTDDHTTTVLNPGIHVVKSGPATASPGQTVTYTFTVTNTGNTPLDSITVNDNVAGIGTYQSGDINNDNILQATETWIYTAKYTIPANQNVSVENTVTACGSPFNRQVEDEISQISLDITSHQVCDQDKHTTNIPLVLGTSTTPKLVNTGQNALFSIFAGLAVIGSVGTLTWASRKR